MPLRKSPPKTTCSLRELLNWVAHDDYDGPRMSGAEAEVAIFGDTSNLEQIEIDQFTRSQSEQAAMDDILSAVRGGEIFAEGFKSVTPSKRATDWKDAKYTDHDDTRIDIPETAWKMGVVDWDQSTLQTPSAEYIGIQLRRAEVEQVWILDESESSSIAEAERFAEQFGISLFDPPPPSQPDTELPQDDIPASDRIVRRSDNEDAWHETAEGVKNLRSEMEKLNSSGELDEAEFQQKLSEVRALQTLLDSPQIQWDVLEQFSQKTVRYLAVKFAEHAIGVAASALLASVAALMAL